MTNGAARAQQKRTQGRIQLPLRQEKQVLPLLPHLGVDQAVRAEAVRLARNMRPCVGVR